MSIFYRNITILISNFFPCRNRNLWLSIGILITYEYFLILAAKLAQIKFLKSKKKKPTLSDVLNFASLSVDNYDAVFALFATTLDYSPKGHAFVGFS